MSFVVYETAPRFNKHFIVGIFGDVFEVTEKEFFEVVGFDRQLVPLSYHKGNKNRQDFFLEGELVGYREKSYS